MRMFVAVPLAALLGAGIGYSSVEWIQTKPNSEACESAARKLRIDAHEARDMCSGLNKREATSEKPADGS